MTTANAKARPRRLGEDELLSTSEVAALLKVDLLTVRKLINDGRLPAHRFCRHYRVWRSDVDSMLALTRIGA